jgi:hypothetical protein
MSDELTALQDTATQARAKADELKAALTDESSTFEEDQAAAAQADADATAAESAFAEAKAKADADAQAAAQAAADATAAPAAAQSADTADTPAAVTDASRTGFADKGLRAGDACVCPDGRTGTVHQYDAGLICMPNETQG